jgi:hypothetical protein
MSKGIWQVLIGATRNIGKQQGFSWEEIYNVPFL